MRATARAIGGVGAMIGLVMVASVLVLGVTLPGFSGEGGFAGDVRAALVGVAIIAVSLTIGAIARRSDLWANHVFVLLGVLGAAAAAWWAVAELLG
ncbi:hypothetical protein ACNI3K_01300 [Demequina sp. SO4-13]|uniref:hypothetical protein n=1 Tax=Demequina sp. SO4-13 TaxID=3401027 RepID=UPI003AF6C62D